MAKDDGVSLTGTVVDVLPGTMFRVKVDQFEKEIISYISGKMRKNNIKVLLGDEVELTVSPYDLTRGRITRRK